MSSVQETGSIDGSTIRPRRGRAATIKKVDGDYDSDDARLIELKQQGYSDDQVARILIKENRVQYLPKTISSRWIRLRKLVEKDNDEILDDELYDWLVGEDDALVECIEAADQYVEIEMQKLRDKKWKVVSKKLADRLNEKKYTAKACFERYESLQDGTALKPLEVDSDQEDRANIRAARIARNKSARAAAKAEVKRIEQARDEYKQLKQDSKMAEYNRLKQDSDQRKADQAKNRQMNKERKEGHEQHKALREAYVEEEKAKAEDFKKTRARESEVYRQLTGKNLRRLVPEKAVSDEEGDEEEAEETDVTDDDETNDAVETTTTADRPNKKARVTKATLENARSIMNYEELDILLFERGLTRRGGDETHPEVVARLAAADAELNSTTLANLLEKYFDRGKAQKNVRIQRLQQHDAKKSSAGEEGVKATDLQFKKTYEGYTGEFASLIDDDGEENEE